MKYTKKGNLDKRFKTNKTLEAREFSFWQKYGHLVVVAILGSLAGIILTKTIFDTTHPKKVSPRPLGEVVVPKVEAQEPITWNDAIRQVFPADEAGRMIRICLREHRGWKGDPKYALNDKNTNGSWDYGWCQINSIHKPASMSDSEWKAYLENPANHAKEVRKIFLSQWWNAWSVYKYGGVR